MPFQILKNKKLTGLIYHEQLWRLAHKVLI